MRFFWLFIFLSGCSSFFYHPRPWPYDLPELHGLEYENRFFSSTDDVVLNGWYIKGEKWEGEGNRPFVVFFHGNAQNQSAHFRALLWALKRGVDVFIFDYRGYGASSGRPSPEGLYDDSLVALDFARDLYQDNKKSRQLGKFIVFGQSLGGNVALRAARDWQGRELIDFVAIDSSFYSYDDVAQAVSSRFAPLAIFSPIISWFISDRYSASEAAGELSAPILVIHGTKDNIVPFSQGRALFESLEEQREKWFWKVEGAGHTQVFHSDYKEYRDKFVELIEGL